MKGPEIKLYRYWELKPVFGIPWSRSYIDRLIKAGRFPEKVHLGPGTVGWTDETMLAYIAEKERESAVVA